MAAARHDLEDAGRQACVGESVAHPLRSERRLLIRLENDGVAGEECRDGVTRRQSQRVVPGSDDSHHSPGEASNARTGGNGYRAAHASFGQQTFRVEGVVAGHRQHIEHFFHRIATGLASLPLQQIQNLLPSACDDVMETGNDGGSLTNARRLP